MTTTSTFRLRIPNKVAEPFNDIIEQGYLEDRNEYSIDMLEDMYGLTYLEAVLLRALIVSAMHGVVIDNYAD